MIALARHGQTDANRDGLLQGRADLPLNERGRAQAAAVGASFATAPAVVCTSPLRRAQETAAAIAAPWGLEVRVDDRLVELDYGEWDERALTEVPVETWARWRADPAFAPPGGESLQAVQARMESWMEEMLDAGHDGVVVGVSHVSPIKAGVAWVLGAGPEVTWRLRLDVGSVSHVTRGPGGPVLQTWNVVPPIEVLPQAPTAG